ncbi:MAG: bacteriophage holin [Endomicrobiales bacterium]
MLKLDVKALGLAMGIMWGISMFLLGLLTMENGLGSGIEQVLATMYIGYKPTVMGSIIGGIWGFIDAGVGGMLLAWLYNRLSK